MRRPTSLYLTAAAWWVTTSVAAVASSQQVLPYHDTAVPGRGAAVAALILAVVSGTLLVAGLRSRPAAQQPPAWSKPLVTLTAGVALMVVAAPAQLCLVRSSRDTDTPWGEAIVVAVVFAVSVLVPVSAASLAASFRGAGVSRPRWRTAAALLPTVGIAVVAAGVAAATPPAAAPGWALLPVGCLLLTARAFSAGRARRALLGGIGALLLVGVAAGAGLVLALVPAVHRFAVAFINHDADQAYSALHAYRGPVYTLRPYNVLRSYPTVEQAWAPPNHKMVLVLGEVNGATVAVRTDLDGTYPCTPGVEAMGGDERRRTSCVSLGRGRVERVREYFYGHRKTSMELLVTVPEPGPTDAYLFQVQVSPTQTSPAYARSLADQVVVYKPHDVTRQDYRDYLQWRDSFYAGHPGLDMMK